MARNPEPPASAVAARQKEALILSFVEKQMA
jgi:hypothetical protein